MIRTPEEQRERDRLLVAIAGRNMAERVDRGTLLAWLVILLAAMVAFFVLVSHLAWWLGW